MIVSVTLPVNARVLYKLEVLAKLCVINMRSTAEVCEVTLVIHCDVAVLKSVYKVKLIHIVLEHLKSFSLSNLSSENLLAFLADLLHLLLDSCDNLIIYSHIAKVDIVVKSFLYNRSYPELSVRIKVLNSLCHNMCT